MGEVIWGRILLHATSATNGNFRVHLTAKQWMRVNVQTYRVPPKPDYALNSQIRWRVAAHPVQKTQQRDFVLEMRLDGFGFQKKRGVLLPWFVGRQVYKKKFKQPPPCESKVPLFHTGVDRAVPLAGPLRRVT